MKSVLLHANQDVGLESRFGHSRLREAVLGGVTRRMMQESPVPQLLGH